MLKLFIYQEILLSRYYNYFLYIIKYVPASTQVFATTTDVAKQSLLNTEEISQIVTAYLVLQLYTAYQFQGEEKSRRIEIKLRI